MAGKINPVKLQKMLKDVEYPAARDTLIEYARAHEATSEVIDFLEHIPDRTYGGPSGVAKEIKGGK